MKKIALVFGSVNRNKEAFFIGGPVVDEDGKEIGKVTGIDDTTVYCEITDEAYEDLVQDGGDYTSIGVAYPDKN